MAEPLVMLAGMMCDARLFQPQTRALEAHYDMIIPPLYGANRIADLVRALLLKLPERFALAGLSMGGIIAMEMMRQASGQITRLALMDTNPFAEPETRQAVRAQQIAKVQAGGLASVIRDEMKPHYLARTENRQQILDLCMDMALGLGDDVFIEQSRMLAGRIDQTDTLAKVAVPTLILFGAEDQLCPPKRHYAMAALIAGAKLERIDNAGHLPCLEQPDATTTALQRWLEA